MASIPWHDVNKVFLLNLIPNTVGDNLMNTPMVAIIKRHRPTASIVMTASPRNVPLFTNLPGLDAVLPLQPLAVIGSSVGKTRKFLAYIRLVVRSVRLLRKIKPDVCFVLQPNFAFSHIIPWLAGVPYRVGFTFSGSFLHPLLTHKTLFRGAFETGEYEYHIVEPNLDLLRVAGVPFETKDVIVKKTITREESSWAEEYLRRLGISSRDTVVGFQAGAKWGSKTWPSENYAEVARTLVSHHNAHVLLFGTEAERPINDIIKSAAGGQLVLGEDLAHVAALLSRCSVLIGNDSGLAHLASAVGTPTVVLYGSTIPAQSRPRGSAPTVAVEGRHATDRPVLPGHDVEKGVELMKSITTEAVIRAASSVLHRPSR